MQFVSAPNQSTLIVNFVALKSSHTHLKNIIDELLMVYHAAKHQHSKISTDCETQLSARKI